MATKLIRGFLAATLMFVGAAFGSDAVAEANPDCFTCGARVGLSMWFIGLAAHHT